MTRIGIFEDEPVLQMMWEDIAEEAGFELSGVCATIGECCELAEDGQMDIAILDVKLAGEYSLRVLEILEKRQIPVLVCTGLDEDDLPHAFTNHVILHKPFAATRAIQQINELCADELAA